MNLLTASGISVYFGERELFSNVTFEVNDKDKIGLVGANGTGKTTLFKLLTGEMLSESGGFAYAGGTTIGYMEQYLCDSSGLTALEETLGVFQNLIHMENELEIISKQLEKEPNDTLILRQNELYESFEREGGLTFRNRARAALLGLGFREEELTLPVSALSGGQRSKISLSKLLLSNARLLLLDEPTNHLDIDAVGWLEEYLTSWNGACIIISHDRYFLDKVTLRTFEIEHSRMRCGNNPYTVYMQRKKTALEIEEKHYIQQKREIERVEGIIKQKRQFNREKSIKQAESRQKQVDKMIDNLEIPPKEQKGIRFSFPVRFPGPEEVLSVQELSKSYDTTLYENVNFDIRKGERVFLIGKNGCGKTTVLKSVVSLCSGVRFGPGVKFGYYEQAQEGLTQSKTAIDEVWDSHRELSETVVRNAMAAFLFRGDDVYKKIEKLSGGERARISILKLMLSGCNFLMLDEPTNHLDLYSREALEQAVLDYGGTLLIVSHDRYFINKLATKILELSKTGVINFDGDYDSYLTRKVEKLRVQTAKKAVGKGGLDWAAQKEQAANIRKLKSQLARIEKEISETEDSLLSRQSDLKNPEISADFEKLIEVTSEIEALNNKDEALLEEWENCSQMLLEFTVED